MPKPGLPKLVATDLDGTIVRDDESVSAYTHEVLARVKAAGIRIVGITGRGPRLIELTRRDLPEADFLVMAQGGRVLDLTDPRGPRVLRSATVPGAQVAAVLAAVEAVTGPLHVLVEASDEPDSPLWAETGPGPWRYPDVVEFRSRADALIGAVLKVFVHSPHHSADELVAMARALVPSDGIEVTQAGLGYMEICPPGVTKATGLAVACDAVGVDPSDVLVFGDMPNDLTMFAWAGWGSVAVANAHEYVRAVADEVTLSCQEDGVAVYLDRLLANRPR
jgi:Cof subfamily protein (haloacid dehalogenase superfamily)